MSRRKKPEGHVNNERWLVSYADFITLLFAFFTTMYAISTVDANKLGKMVLSMRASFDNPVFSAGSDRLSLSSGGGVSDAPRRLVEPINPSEPAVGLKGKETVSGAAAMEKMRRVIDEIILKNSLQGKVRTRLEPRGLIISLGEAGLFDSGSDQMKAEGRAVLDSVALGLVPVGNYLRIEGHTDNIPIANSRFPSNWELSTARATSLVVYMIGQFRFAPDRLSATGYAEYRPTSSNETLDGRAQNRRVDIVVLDPSIVQVEPH
jgi:chemotaxis protein MotB